jgi:hypothetical protein
MLPSVVLKPPSAISQRLSTVELFHLASTRSAASS